MERIKAALDTTGYQFVMYAWDYAPKGDYGVLSVESGEDFIADGIHVERGTSGFVDYFTRDASEEPRNRIENALNGVCAFSLESVQYEEDTRYIHYEWAVRIHG